MTSSISNADARVVGRCDAIQQSVEVICRSELLDIDGVRPRIRDFFDLLRIVGESFNPCACLAVNAVGVR